MANPRSSNLWTWSSPPHPAFITSALGVAALTVVLPFTVFAPWFGFVPLPLEFLLALAAIIAIYLFAVEHEKRWFLVRHGQ